MKKIKILILLCVITLIISCVDSNKQLQYLKTLYPNCKVEPSTGLIQNQGYEFIVIDSTNQIIAVSFYEFSETKISNLRNIR